MIYFQSGSADTIITPEDLKEALFSTFSRLGIRKNVLVIPPDFTRKHSFAGDITGITYKYYGNNLRDILPAIGTHAPMTDRELDEMFKNIPHDLFRVHDWRKDVVTIGSVPGELVSEISGGIVNYPYPAQVNKLVFNGGHDLIISVGQVVPHEVIGMANFNKNLLVGTGGSEGINKSHFIGAAYGMEKIMGKADTPVRRLLNYASDKYLRHLPIIYILTVVKHNINNELVICGLYIGDDEEVFHLASNLSLKVNLNVLDNPLKKVVVYLDPAEFKVTWVGNKSIYRTRMAMADNGELIVLAPGLREFGEDKEIDRLIRKYGYRGTPATLLAIKENEDLRNNLSAAAHLIHGSSEGRFKITYCPGNITKKEIESVGFLYGDLDSMLKKYNPEKLKDGFNSIDNGEEIFYISNPALGLWAWKEKM